MSLVKLSGQVLLRHLSQSLFDEPACGLAGRTCKSFRMNLSFARRIHDNFDLQHF
jgi:hypothetical protein